MQKSHISKLRGAHCVKEPGILVSSSTRYWPYGDGTRHRESGEEEETRDHKRLGARERVCAWV